jgi:hypothetical protein
LDTDIQDLDAAPHEDVASDDPGLLLDVAVRWADGRLLEDRYEDWLLPQQDRVAECAAPVRAVHQGL